MQYKLLVSDFDNTLVPFGEPKPRPAVVKAVKKLQAAGVKFALRTAGLGVCMDNGTEEAKAAADRIIGDVREDGLAALIEELWFDGPKAEPSGRDLGSAWAQIESAGGQ